VQYWFWLRQALNGDFGYSFAQRRPASDLIVERVGGTLILTCAAFGLTLILAVVLGLVAALNAGRWPDGLSQWLSLTGLSLPTVLASIGFLYFAYLTGWFPIGGADTWMHVILPSITLAIPSAALLARTLRLELIEALAQPYVRAAVAKGLPGWRVIWHAFRNAANPVISLAGVTLGGLLSGAVVVEKVFGWPGIGSLIVDSILGRDLYVALYCVLLVSIFVIAANLLADVLLAWNDPRVRSR
jgi:peptide/nickel transport system permease protein